MTRHLAAQDMWAGLPKEKRKDILDQLGAHHDHADNDWAALPPELQNPIIDGMPVEAAEGEAEGGPEHRGRRKRGGDD